MERQTEAADLRVYLLGTGGPELSVDRLGSATLIQAGSETILVDAGRGVMQRLFESGVSINSVTKVIFTHLHSDHIEGLPNLWITPWFLLGRKTKMEFHGPVGTASMLKGMRLFLGRDVVGREEEGCPASDLDFSVHRRIILSGDCTFSEDLASAGPADVVIHNVFAPSSDLLARDPFKRRVAEKLASPEQAGEVFRRTNTKLAVFTHVIRMDSTEQDIIDRTRLVGYNGALIIGEDRMRIDIGDRPVIVDPIPLSEISEVTSRGHG
jgi:ribonuclease Z